MGSKLLKNGICNFMAKGGAFLDIFRGGVVLMDAADATHRGVKRCGKRFSYRTGNEFIFVPEAIDNGRGGASASTTLPIWGSSPPETHTTTQAPKCSMDTSTWPSACSKEKRSTANNPSPSVAELK